MKSIVFKISIVATVLLNVSLAFGQKGKLTKADKGLDRFGYIDAREIYLKVIEDGYASAQIYENLGDTYYWNSDYKNAAKWYGKLITEFPGETSTPYYYRASQSFKSIDKLEESKSFMRMYIENGGDPGILKASANHTTIEYIATLGKASINTEYSDFGPAFYLDKLVYSSSAIGNVGDNIHQWNNQPFTDLFIADMDELGNLSNSRPLEGDVNTKYHESNATFTKDGKTMYFTRNNFIDGKKRRDKEKTIKLKIYKASNDNGLWNDVVELPFNSDDYSIAHPALSADEKRLYFASEMDGSIGMSDIWYVDINSDKSYGEPVNLGPSINTEARESFPFISAENDLYFSSDGRGGLGGFDVFVTTLDEQGKPTEINNLGEPVNSAQDDFGFIANKEKKLAYVSSNRGAEGGSINDDIYQVSEICMITLTGKVFDVDTKGLLPGASVSLFDSNNELVETIVVGTDAMYSFNADCEEDYSIRGSKLLYAPYEKFVQTPDETSTIEVPVPLKIKDPCPPNDLGCRLCLQPIFFDFDKFNIRPDAEIELAKILVAMREYPQLVIHIESHTDSRAPLSYNDILSDKRAQSTRDWLMSKGISAERLTAKGYGERQLLDRCLTFDECGKVIGSRDCTPEEKDSPKCSDGVVCTEEEHQLNRRSVFIIKN